MKKATEFYELNKPYILNKLKYTNELFSIELDSKKLAKLFDMYAGIDYILFNKKLNKLYGVAARVNFYWKTKGCLTIRYKRNTGACTEFSKRMASIKSDDSLYPNLTIQVDSSKDNKPEGGIILRTKDLYLYLDENITDIKNKYMKTCKEGNDYLAIPFHVINSEFNIKCRIF
ncbi:MAG: hypothetical protein QNK20_05150 [Aureibaculum sp.]|nr:hypothetical protein [Aureibaculum sp.]